MTTATFSMPIAMFQGHGLAIENLPEPVWAGTLEQYLDANADAYTFGQAREVLLVLDYGRMVPIDGGAEPAHTLISQRKLTELRFWDKMRAA